MGASCALKMRRARPSYRAARCNPSTPRAAPSPVPIKPFSGTVEPPSGEQKPGRRSTGTQRHPFGAASVRVGISGHDRSTSSSTSRTRLPEQAAPIWHTTHRRPELMFNSPPPGERRTENDESDDAADQPNVVAPSPATSNSSSSTGQRTHHGPPRLRGSVSTYIQN